MREEEQNTSRSVMIGFFCMKIYYLYILHSISSDKYYVGQSWDYKERLFHHNRDKKNTRTLPKFWYCNNRDEI